MSTTGRSVHSRWLSELLCGVLEIPHDLDRQVLTLVEDSRDVAPGAMFVARTGNQDSGERYIQDAIARGAIAVLRQGASAVIALDAAHSQAGMAVVELSTPDLLSATGQIADRFHHHASMRCKFVAVTGTNGKTTVTHFIAQALDSIGMGPSGLIGTLGYGFRQAMRDGGLTTPGMLRLHSEVDDLVRAGARFVIAEASSHALAQRRLEGISVDTGVFTNLSHDHLDYHGDLDSYAAAKQRLFERPEISKVVLNADDPQARRIRLALAARTDPAESIAIMCFGHDAQADLRIESVQIVGTSQQVRLMTPEGPVEVLLALPGRFNVDNALAALAVLLLHQVTLKQAVEALESLSPVPGRLERIDSGLCVAEPIVLVDYAHTPDALNRALQAARSITQGRLWCVFGCGGDRDVEKRSQMGEIANRYADRSIITDDNPRGEDGDKIIAAIMQGIKNPGATVVERDRAKAIASAIGEAEPADCVLIAGKGHEQYQILHDIKTPFCDAQQALAALRARAQSTGHSVC